MRSLLLILFACFIVAPCTGQAQGKTDSVSVRDTTRIDSVATTRRDTTKSVTGVDTIVSYASRDSIVYSLPTKTMSLYSNGNVKYRQMGLQADRIDVDWNTQIMTSFGVADTSDTAKTKLRGTPIMKDGGEEYHGHALSYNFRTKKGRIQIADTHVDQGYYHGEQIKKIAPDIMFVGNGRYTTCEEPDPHYYFYSPKMKVMLKDKVIAEPVFLYVSDVPIFWLPLAVFPNKAGRRSGIIAPAIAEDATHGRLLRHLGYYWATNDYMDLSMRTDLYTKGSWALYSDYRYALRYSFSGSFSGYYRKLIEGEPSDPSHVMVESYRASIVHHQDIDPNTRFNVDFTFASQNSYRNTIDLNEALSQSIYSNATLSKSWEGTPNSMSISVQRNQNLVDGSISATLPSIQFNHSQSYPFRFGHKSSTDVENLAWYEMIGMSYSASASNQQSKTSKSIDSIRVSVDGVDTLETVKQFERDRSQSISQSVSMNIAPKLGHFTISPSISYNDQRSFSNNDVPKRNPADSSVVDTNIRQAIRSGSISAGVTASTKLYGIVQPQMLGIQAIRHTVTPTLSFTYSKQVIGTNFSRKQMLMNMSVGNVFEMKTPSSEEGKEGNKIQLLNLSAGLSYNFAADSLKFSAIDMSYRTAIGNLLNIGGSAAFDLYKQDPVGYQRINTFLINSEHRLARLTNFSLSLSTSLAGEKKKSSSHTPSNADATQPKQPTSGFSSLSRDEEPDFSIPWRLGLTMDYSESKVQPSPSRSSNLHANLEFNLTENWKFSVSSSYDVLNRQFLYPDIHITRDLHCWIMDFTWIPIGTIRSYQFELRLKASQLRDIKLTKQGSESGIYGD